MHEGRQGIDEPAAVSVSINWPRIDRETLSPISGKSSSKFQGTTETTTSTNHQPVDIWLIEEHEVSMAPAFRPVWIFLFVINERRESSTFSCF